MDGLSALSRNQQGGLRERSRDTYEWDGISYAVVNKAANAGRERASIRLFRAETYGRASVTASGLRTPPASAWAAELDPSGTRP